MLQSTLSCTHTVAAVGPACSHMREVHTARGSTHCDNVVITQRTDCATLDAIVWTSCPLFIGLSQESIVTLAA